MTIIPFKHCFCTLEKEIQKWTYFYSKIDKFAHFYLYKVWRKQHLNKDLLVFILELYKMNKHV